VRPGRADGKSARGWQDGQEGAVEGIAPDDSLRQMVGHGDVDRDVHAMAIGLDVIAGLAHQRQVRRGGSDLRGRYRRDAESHRTENRQGE